MSLIAMLHLDRILYGILSGVAIFLIAYPIALRKKPPKIRLYYGLICIYIGILIFVTMLFAPPWDWNVSQGASIQIVRDINLNPFVYTEQLFRNCAIKGSYTEFIVLVGGNLLLLAPIGVLVPLVTPLKYITGKFGLVRIFFLATVVSACVEALQLLGNILLGSSLRTVEIDDLIFNVLGCVVAYLVFMGIRAFMKKKEKAPREKN